MRDVSDCVTLAGLCRVTCHPALSARVLRRERLRLHTKVLPSRVHCAPETILLSINHLLHLTPSSLGRLLIRTLAQPSISFCHASLPSQPQAAVTNEGSFYRQGMVDPRLLKTYEFVALHVLCRLPQIAHAGLHKTFWPVMLNAGRRVPPAPRIDMPSIQTTPQSSRTWVQATMQAMLPAGLSLLHSFSHHGPRTLAAGRLDELVTSLPSPHPHQHPHHFQDRPSTAKLRPRCFLSFTSLLTLPGAF